MLKEPVFVKRKAIDASIHSFILTDLDGNKTFAIVMTYYREFYCCTEVSYIIINNSFYVQTSFVSLIEGLRFKISIG
jgi:hypothetical protein